MSNNSTTLTYDANKTNYGILFAICFSHLGNDLIQSVIPTALPMLKSNYSLSFAQVGIITFCFQVTSSLLQPIVGRYTDKHPMPYSQIIGFFFSTLGIVLLSYAWSYHWILISVSLIGVGSSIFHPESSRIAFFSSGGKRSLAQSIFQIGGNTGSALGPVLLALIVTPYGQRNIIWIALVAISAQIILTYVAKWYSLVVQTSKKIKDKIIHVPDLTKKQVNSAITILLVLIFSKYIYIASITSYLQFFTMEKFGITENQAHIYLFYFLIAVAIGTLLGGYLGDKIGRKYVIWLSILGCAPFALALPYVNLFWTGVLVFIVGTIIASAFPAILVYSQELLPHKLGMVSGLFYGFAFGMGGVCAALLGWWADYSSITFIYKVVSFSPLIGIIAYYLPDMKSIHFTDEIQHQE
ncbi:MAG: MFS transporter [Chitinophagales bacterium]|nr:MFS transporter [Chitinophagales bacterium]